MFDLRVVLVPFFKVFNLMMSQNGTSNRPKPLPLPFAEDLCRTAEISSIPYDNSYARGLNIPSGSTRNIRINPERYQNLQKKFYFPFVFILCPTQ